MDHGKRARDDEAASVGDGSARDGGPLKDLQTTVDAVRGALDDSSGKLKKLQVQLQTQAAAAQAHVKKESEMLRMSGQELDEEKRRMEEHAGQVAERVTLDVGGTLFTTSRSTLLSRPSFLAGMFSGRHALQPSSDGSHFIDRDPTHFRAILNYLRSGAIAVPSDDKEKAELLREADFYALDDLARELRAPTVELDLGAEITAERQREDELRAIFASADFDKQSLQPHESFIDIFGDDGVAASLLFAPCSAFPLVLTSSLHQAAPGGRVAVADLAAFRANFSKRNPNILQRLGPLLTTENIFIAGGAVLHALTEGDTRTGHSVWSRDEVGHRKSDIDVFLHATSPAEATRICRAIFFALAVDEERWLITRGKGVVNMTHYFEPAQHWGAGDTLTVQVVLRLYDSPAEVLHGFDIDCYADEHDMIFPSVFGPNTTEENMTDASGVPSTTMIFSYLNNTAHYSILRASSTRLLAWSEINDAGQKEPWTSEHVARKLDDAWDTSKRSREYLNAKDGDLDARYYVHGHTLPAAV